MKGWSILLKAMSYNTEHSMLDTGTESSPQGECRPLINKPPPLYSDLNRDPKIEALKRRWFVNHGSRLVSLSADWASRFLNS